MIPSGYDTIKLVDAAGELVKYTFVPPLRVRPDILVWGSRMFIPVDATVVDQSKNRSVSVYREAVHLHAVYISDKETEIA